MHGKKHDIFYEKVLKVKDFAILTFADFVQRLLVYYIRDVLLHPEAEEWFSTWWTRARCQYCLAHAGYGGLIEGTSRGLSHPQRQSAWWRRR